MENKEGLILFFDTETTGFPSKKIPLDDPKQPHLLQLGMILSSREQVYAEVNLLVRPRGEYSIHPKAEEVHGISKDMVMEGGVKRGYATDLFINLLTRSSKVACHNYGFDSQIIDITLAREYQYEGTQQILKDRPHYCTMLESVQLCNLPGRYGKPKWPKLQELHQHLFGCGFEGAHDALEDVRAMRRCYYAMNPA